MTSRPLTILLATSLCSTLAWGVAGAAPSPMHPGLWEITTEMDMPGMPMKLPPQVVRHCYTAKELADARNTVPQGGKSNCRMDDYHLDGNTATWKMSCSGQNSMHGSGTTTFNGDSYQGEMHSTMQGPGGHMQMTNRWHGKRVGDCR